VSGYTVAQGSNSLQCKDEPEFADACVAASVELHPFGGDIHELGLVQIDSSSGSDLTLAVAQTVIQVPVNMSPTQCHDQHTLSTCLMRCAQEEPHPPQVQAWGAYNLVQNEIESEFF
jgi:hypothetical protein